MLVSCHLSADYCSPDGPQPGRRRSDSRHLTVDGRQSAWASAASDGRRLTVQCQPKLFLSHPLPAPDIPPLPSQHLTPSRGDHRPLRSQPLPVRRLWYVPFLFSSFCFWLWCSLLTRRRISSHWSSYRAPGSRTNHLPPPQDGRAIPSHTQFWLPRPIPAIRRRCDHRLRHDGHHHGSFRHSIADAICPITSRLDRIYQEFLSNKNAQGQTAEVSVAVPSTRPQNPSHDP